MRSTSLFCTMVLAAGLMVGCAKEESKPTAPAAPDTTSAADHAKEAANEGAKAAEKAGAEGQNAAQNALDSLKK